MRHLLLRGGLLIAIKFLVVNRAWEWSLGGWEPSVYIGVLFALGGTVILGSLLLWLNPQYLLILTAVLLVGTEWLTPAARQWSQIFLTLQRLLLIPGGNRELWVNYPVLPWLGLVTLGMTFGHWLAEDARKAFERALKLGMAFLLTFLLVRCLDGFGNIRARAGNSWIDFFNVVKYPPSIVFTLLAIMASPPIPFGASSESKFCVVAFDKPLYNTRNSRQRWK